jgi:Fe-S-cluster containining protein
LTPETLRRGLPEVYARLLPPFFDRQAPPEPKATCASCPMCAPVGGAPAGSYFRPDTKCCTYHPYLPGYLVGGLLGDGRADVAEGQRRVRQTIASRIGISPRWVAPPRKSAVLYGAARRACFGRSLALRCPYYEPGEGLCTIWRWRESVCSTFFCKYGAGADGQNFWGAMEAYLREVETRLTDDAVARIAPDLAEPAVELGQLTLEDMEDGPPSPEDYADLWRGWQGREEELYRACYEHIAGLATTELEAIAGANAATLLADVEEAHRAMVEPVLPERLVVDPGLTSQQTASGSLVSTYSTYDPLLLSPALHELLQAFRVDETVHETCDRLRRDQGVEVSRELLVALWQMRVLVREEEVGRPLPPASLPTV